MRCGHHKPMAAVKAGCVEIASQMTVEQGFRAIVSHCVAQMQDNESGVAGRTDPQSVHQMRVGMRRLRSALGLFTESMPFPEVLQSETRLAGG